MLRVATTLLVVVLLSSVQSCKKGPPPVVDPETVFHPIIEDVIRRHTPMDLRPELIPLESRKQYVPAQDDSAPTALDRKPVASLAGPPTVQGSSGSITLEELLNKATDRQTCNMVMGCEADKGLVALGKSAVRPVIDRYKEMKRPSYQKFHLLDVLGAIGDSSAVPFLEGRLRDKHWNSRANAAVALGKIGSLGSLKELKRLLGAQRKGRDYGFLYALAWAVEKLGGTGGQEVILEALDSANVQRRNWGYTRVAVSAAADLNIVDACAALPTCILHNDTFLKKKAISASATLSCTADVVLRAIAAQLSNRVPSVRRAATASLKQLTGKEFTSFEDFDQYRKSVGAD